MSKELKTTKVEKKKKRISWHSLLRLFVLLILAVLAYAGVMSLIKADIIVANAIAVVVVVLLVKEAF